MTDSARCSRCRCELPAGIPDELCPACLLQAGLTGLPADIDAVADVPADPWQPETTPHRGGFVPPPAESLAPLFPQLEVLKVLGHGGMGAVYQARQKKLDRLVALKIIRPEGVADPAFTERFMREARTLARLGHPGIVAVHDFGEVESCGPDAGTLYYFVMEFVDGANLRQIMESGELTTAQALAIVPQVCEALQFAHDAGVVHRDIKPENILVDAKGRVKIADFGLAKLAARSPEDFTLTATHQVMGTPRYMAPEQMTGSHSVDHRADIYSLGVVLYEMLTGEVPLGQFAPPSQKAGVDVRLDHVVLRALAREPERRFQQASELQAEVNHISSGTGPVTAPAQAAFFRGGPSTIMERELAGVWRWVAGDAVSTTSTSPSFPTAIVLLLTIAGCLMVLLPWCDINVPGRGSAHEPTAGTSTDPVAVLDQSFPLRTASLWPGTTARQNRVRQPTVRPASLSFQAASLPLLAQDQWPGTSVADVTQTVYGLETPQSIGACIAFAVLTLLVLMFPERSRCSLAWNLVALLVAGHGLISTLLFLPRIPYHRVTLPASYSDVFLQEEPMVEPESDAALKLCFWQSNGWEFPPQDTSGRPSRRITMPANNLEYTVTYRAGFVGSLGLALTLIVLAATGIRNAVATSSATGTVPAQAVPDRITAAVPPVPDSEALRKLRAEVRMDTGGPALLLIVLGCLSIVGNAIAGVIIWNDPVDRDKAFIFIPGCVIGILMLIGGINLRRLASLGWVQVAAVTAVLPLSVGWLVTALAGIWTLNTLKKPHIRDAFLRVEQEKQPS